MNRIEQLTSSINYKTLSGAASKALAKAPQAVALLSGLALATQLIYNRSLSPSNDLDPSSSALGAFYNRYVTSCDDPSMQSIRSTLNLFETKQSLYSFLGLQSSEPFGDMQGFALDGNTEALNCIKQSYNETSFTQPMKNRLLTKVIRQIQLNHKDITESAKWLINQGAYPFHQEVKSSKDLQNSPEAVFHPLLTAYHTLDSDFFKFLLERKASALSTIPYFSKTSKQFDEKVPILEAIIRDIETTADSFDDINQKKLFSAYACPIYQEMIEAAFEAMEKNRLDIPEHDLYLLRIKTFYSIKEKICPRNFKLDSDTMKDYFAEELAGNYKNFKENFYKKFAGESFDPQFGSSKEKASSSQNFDSEYIKPTSTENDDELETYFKKFFSKREYAFGKAFKLVKDNRVTNAVLKGLDSVKDFSKSGLQAAGSATVNGIKYTIYNAWNALWVVKDSHITKAVLNTFYSIGDFSIKTAWAAGSKTLSGLKYTENALGNAAALAIDNPLTNTVSSSLYSIGDISIKTAWVAGSKTASGLKYTGNALGNAAALAIDNPVTNTVSSSLYSVGDISIKTAWIAGSKTVSGLKYTGNALSNAATLAIDNPLTNTVSNSLHSIADFSKNSLQGAGTITKNALNNAFAFAIDNPVTNTASSAAASAGNGLSSAKDAVFQGAKNVWNSDSASSLGKAINELKEGAEDVVNSASTLIQERLSTEKGLFSQRKKRS